MWIHIIIILLAASIGYSNSIYNDFLMDDQIDLFSTAGVSYKTLKTVFLIPQLDIYRPFSHFFCWIAYHLFGTDPVGYHLANLCLFMMINIFFYLIVYTLTKNKNLALLTSVLYCLHPINSMLVNYISAIQICIYILVTQLAFLFLILSIQKKENRLLYYLSLVFYLFSLMSHEMSYFFPLFVVCAMYFIYNYPTRKIAIGSLPFFFMAFLYYGFRMLAFEIHSGNEGPSYIYPHLGIFLSTYFEMINWYLSKLVIPKDIIFLWSSGMDYRMIIEDGKYFLAIPLGAHRYIVLEYFLLFLMAGTSFYLIFIRWKKGLKPFLLSVFIIGLLTVGYAGYIYFPMVKPIIEPHWFYFTSFGFFVFLASGMLNLKAKMNTVFWGLIVLLILAGYFVSLREHNTKWRDQETYCRYWLSLNKGNMTPFYWLGVTFMERGQYREAAESIEEGLTVTYGVDRRILADLGYAYIKSGNREKGMKNLQNALKIGGIGHAPLHYYFGEYYLQEGDLNSAVIAYTAAATLNPREQKYRKKLEFVTKKIAAKSDLPQ